MEINLKFKIVSKIYELKVGSKFEYIKFSF